MVPPPQIIVGGSHGPGLFIHVDRKPVAGEKVSGWGYEEPVDGVKDSNQPIARARPGGCFSIVGCVGEDRLDDLGDHWSREAGVDTQFLKHSSKHPAIGGSVFLDKDGVLTIVAAMSANGDLTVNDVGKALGERGMIAADKDGLWMVSAPSIEVIDTAGAGDAFSGVLALGLAEGLSKRDSANHANVVASYSATKRGTIPIFPTLSDADQFTTEIKG